MRQCDSSAVKRSFSLRNDLGTNAHGPAKVSLGLHREVSEQACSVEMVEGRRLEAFRRWAVQMTKGAGLKRVVLGLTPHPRCLHPAGFLKSWSVGSDAWLRCRMERRTSKGVERKKVAEGAL